LLAKLSQHPSILSQQIRCGPRNTYNPSHFVRKRRHGFLSRIRTRSGRATIARRKRKKRSTLSH
jgi:large subunit ribosomal protein L34